MHCGLFCSDAVKINLVRTMCLDGANIVCCLEPSASKLFHTGEFSFDAFTLQETGGSQPP